MEQVFVQLQCSQLKSFDTEVYCSFADPISVLIFDFMHIRVSSANLFYIIIFITMTVFVVLSS